METLKDKINKFLAVDIDYCHVNYYDYICDYDSNSDIGSGSGYGYGGGCGEGYYYGEGYGSGYKCCSGSGDESGYGYGCGYNCGLKEINGKKIYIVDGIQTIFTSIRGNVAKGYIVQPDLQLTPCYVVREDNKFAHGNTLRDAFYSIQEKLYDDNTGEERIEAFKKKFPNYDEKYDNRDLFAYHHVLTGSCKMGRENFIKCKGLSLDGKTSIREFVELTKDAYGGEIIKKLSKEYKL